MLAFEKGVGGIFTSELINYFVYSMYLRSIIVQNSKHKVYFLFC